MGISLNRFRSFFIFCDDVHSSLVARVLSRPATTRSQISLSYVTTPGGSTPRPTYIITPHPLYNVFSGFRVMCVIIAKLYEDRYSCRLHHRIDKPHYECSSWVLPVYYCYPFEDSPSQMRITELNERRFKSCIIPILLR
jgi:hypothetical protein